MQKIIWTIGHSTRSVAEFISLLQAHSIALLADIRTFPGSRRYPHFNKDALMQSLNDAGIEYLHIPELGGRRKPKPDSANTQWKNEGFRGYADYMETEAFKTAINKLEELALQKHLAYMCSEAVWWRCHRGLVSDYLKEKCWTVLHIMDQKKAEEHPFTSAYREQQGKLFD